MKNLKGKKILITAGSTWVALDKVRVITNIFRGNLGYKIAETASRAGAKVTLLLGAGIDPKSTKDYNINVVRFKYFDELNELVKSNLKNNSFDIMINSAAISDYTPENPFDGKVKSGKNRLIIKLKPTIKIIDYVKKIVPNIFLVKFKLEVGVTDKELINIAYKSMQHSKADLIVANKYDEKFKDHSAYIIDKEKNIRKCNGKKEIAEDLLKILSERL